MVDGDRDDERARAALRAAQMYYMQDLTMEAIASDLHTSRSAVSRLLSHARASGLVDIQIRSPFDAATELERELGARHGIAVHIVPSPQNITDVDRLDRVALTAARLLARFVDSNMTVGIASAISRHLVPKDTHNVTVVQMNGAGSCLTTGIDYTSEILRRSAMLTPRRSSSSPCRGSSTTRKPAGPVARAQHTSRTRHPVAHGSRPVRSGFTVRGCSPSGVHRRYLDDADFASLSRDEIVGDVATVFYRAGGSWRDVTLNARATGPAFDELRRVARRVCVVAGEQKVPSLRGALAARLVTDLVIDEGAAHMLGES